MADNQPIEPSAIEPGAGEDRSVTVNLVQPQRGSLLARLGWVRLLLIAAALALAAMSYYAINHDGDFPGADPIRTVADQTTLWFGVLVNHRDTRDERAEFPDPAQRHLALKELMVELTNARRAEAGVPPVRIGHNPAAQLHAEGSLEGCYASHWDRWGLKPHHRYSLSGGTGAGAENVAGLDYCIRFLDGHLPIRSMEDEVAEAVTQWMRSPDHRRVMLDPAHTLLNVGIAHDRFNANLVQHFTSDYVRYEQEPAIDSQGVLRFRGTVDGATLEIGETVNVQVAYDPPPRYLTTGQLAHTYALCSPVTVAHLVAPPPRGTYYAGSEVREELTWQKCVDPYATPADHPRPASSSEANKALTVAMAASDAPAPVRTGSLRIIADRMEITADRFDVQADLSPILDQHGPGIYTVRLWGLPRHLAEPTPLSERSIFRLTAPPHGAPY